ncbi:hypothetical protein [Streptomyces chartreusis]|uniref:hypothetical protein n=1 Tax=Streptomyces chartreusis TaxID=1969 RepID=UPI001679D943|nr:hypothetical protein [Streptomyces chartreusis]GGX58192.1 hypothetical protein GCM10010321_88890 [Streptomyces chartreusis]
MSTFGKKLAHTHNLAVLAGYLVQLAPMFRMHPQGDVVALCCKVHALDPDGQALLHSMVEIHDGTTVLAALDLSTSASPSSCAGRARRAPHRLLLDQTTNVRDSQRNLGTDYGREQR